MPLPARQRAERAFREAWLRGCSMGDCDQAYWLAYDGIEPAQVDHDYQPSPHDRRDRSPAAASLP